MDKHDPWRVRTLVFDLDDTLYAERDYVISGFNAVGRWVEYNLKKTGFAEVAGGLFAAGLRGKIFDEALAKLGIAADRRVVEQMLATYRGHVPNIQLFPDAKVVLAWARTRFDLALISDGYLVAQRMKLAALQLDDVIPKMFLTDEWGRDAWKPSPRAFHEVMAATGGSGAACVYVADNPRKDFIAPRALGWHTVRVRRPGGEQAGYEPSPQEAAEREISRLDCLKELLLPVEETHAS